MNLLEEFPHLRCKCSPNCTGIDKIEKFILDQFIKDVDLIVRSKNIRGSSKMTLKQKCEALGWLPEYARKTRNV